ncbi:LacI family DNA-binding transcriptional regulator [uncultured Microbacterium sp.]|uniref:LacI family DNA-binding transcriptional regulator n=1 Tax=uncultured Microbacterium sp. TaxID=191216 RepID=UPI002626D3FF|nr:LacI family DNA-binding transcriptional regulator [uncultured Microbacterium sp.]
MNETGEERTRTASIRDVARAADVSYQTVSRVLNDHPSIRPATKQRVLDAMEELRYRPNQAARALVTSRSSTLGVILGSRGEYGPTSSLAALEDSAREQGYWVNSAYLRDTKPETIHAAVEHLRRQSVEGIVVHAPQVRVFDILAELNVDIPYLGLNTAERGIVELAEDQVRGGRMATEHLIELGHVEIVHVAGPQDWIEAESRMRGYLHALSDADLPTRAPILGDWTADFGYRAALELSHRLDFTAVFAANDAMAIGLMHGFRDVGIDVPRRVSIVGFDDIPLAAHSWPPLTTVHQQFASLGRRAVAELLRLINADDAPPLVASIEPSLVVRASTAPAFGHQK